MHIFFEIFSSYSANGTLHLLLQLYA